jgi:hypothetical protein
MTSFEALIYGFVFSVFLPFLIFTTMSRNHVLIAGHNHGTNFEVSGVALGFFDSAREVITILVCERHRTSTLGENPARTEQFVSIEPD